MLAFCEFGSVFIQGDLSCEQKCQDVALELPRIIDVVPGSVTPPALVVMTAFGLNWSISGMLVALTSHLFAIQASILSRVFGGSTKFGIGQLLLGVNLCLRLRLVGNGGLTTRSIAARQ